MNSKMCKKVTQDELVEILKSAPACNIILDTVTTPKMKKGGRAGVEPNPFIEKEVTKSKTAEYIFGKNYIEAINENLQKEGKAPVDPVQFDDKLPWGEYEVKDRIIKYNDARYIRCYPGDDTSFSSETYYIDGVEATPEEMEKLKPYLPVSDSSSKKQEDAGLSKENQVRPLLFKFDNIKYIAIDNHCYEII